MDAGIVEATVGVTVVAFVLVGLLFEVLVKTCFFVGAEVGTVVLITVDVWVVTVAGTVVETAIEV